MRLTHTSEDWLARMQELANDAPAVDYACSNCCDRRYLVDAEGTWRGQCPECNPALAAGLPLALKTVQLADVRQHAGNRLALERAQAFIEDRSRDLFIFGGVGTGKTFLSAAIGNAVCARRGRDGVVRFVRWPMTLHKLSPSGAPDGERGQLEQLLFESKVLIMDDLGAERDTATDFTRRTAFLVYEERGDRNLPTVITSNLSLDQLAQHFGDDRLTSRIAGRADVVEITGDDQRLRSLKGSAR